MAVYKQILLVEDDPQDIELTLDALSDYNLANGIIVARDGQEALDYLYRKGKFTGCNDSVPALIMLDINMPKVDGITVLKTIKTDPVLKTIPIVVLTSSREAKDLENAYQLGVNAYVVKPVKFPDFVDAVKQIGVFWVLINEAPPLKSLDQIK